ncbi:MAG: hypothetical protein RIC52_16795 [Amphiplicatus sp.]
MQNNFDPAAPRSQYKTIIAHALHEHSRLTTRQENDPDADISDLFTDNKQLRTLEKVDWQILFGRRGAGKTTLLHKLADVLDEKVKYASLNLSLQKCIVDLPANTPDRIKGLVQFEKFVMEIGYLLYRIYLNRNSSKNKNRKITKLFQYFSNETHTIESAILNIATFAHRGVVFGAENEKTTSVTTKKERASGFGFGSKIDLSLLKGAEAFSAHANAEIQRKMAGLSESKYEETAYIDFSALKREFVELLDALKIDTLYILIDEWSAIDRRHNPASQVYFAEYLKRAFFGTSRICVKISAIEHESRFAEYVEVGRIGLEVGADIFAQVNLDHIYNNRVLNLSQFFQEVLYKRLKHCDKNVEIFGQRDNKGVPIEGFMDIMFAETGRMEEIIHASGGIPRDFINIFDAVASEYDYSVDEKWKKHKIKDVIMRRAIERAETILVKNSLIDCVYSTIRESVNSSGHRVVLIEKDLDPDIVLAVESLFSSRMLHKLDIATVPEEIRLKYIAYETDYGVFLDWTRDRKRTKSYSIDMKKFSRGDLLECVVDISRCAIMSK